jgi:ribosomal protein L11 methyltransferase
VTEKDSWHKLTIETEKKAEELVTGVLRESGSEGVELIDLGKEDHLKVISYHKEKPDIRIISCITKGLIEAVFENDPVFLDIHSEEIEEKNWVKIQADSLGIVKITDKIWIIPPWKRDEFTCDDPEKIHIIINPGSAFGTGEHPTTRMCIEALVKYVKKNDMVLDLGAGSGILGIAALKFGASRITAVELDPNAFSNGWENCELNGFSEKIAWHTGTIKTLDTDDRFDIIVANIFSHVVLNDAEWIRRFASKSAKYIFSGILFEGGTDFIRELSAKGYRMIDSFRLGEWMAFVMEDA